MPEYKDYPMSRAGLEEARTDFEKAGHNVFRASQWDEKYARGITLKEANFGSLQGMGCTYFFYHRGDGTTVATVRPDGPWPWASIETVVSDELPYEETVIAVIASDMLSGGVYEPIQVVEMLHRVTGSHIKRLAAS